MSQNKHVPVLWTTEEMARYRRVTVRTIYNQINKGAYNGELAPRAGKKSKYLFYPPTATGTNTSAA